MSAKALGKRKRGNGKGAASLDQLGDDDTDNIKEKYGNQTLPVAILPADFSGDPADGAQYLAVVRREAQSHPPVFYAADNPYATLQSAPRQKQRVVPPTVHQPDLPSEEWRASFLERFRNMRESLSLKPTERMPQPSGLVKLPKGKGAAGWYRFVHGREEPSNEPAAETDGTQEGDEEMDAADGADEDEADAASSDDADASAVGALLESDNVQVAPPPAETVASMPSTPDPVPTEPSPALLRRFKQQSILRLLEIFPYWLASPPSEPPTAPPTQPNPIRPVLDPLHSRWLFALLAHLDSRLVSDDISTLRTLARACIAAVVLSRMRRAAARFKAKVGSDGDENSAAVVTLVDEDPLEGEMGAWMVVCAVAGIWGQSDLWQDADSDLSRLRRT